MTRIPSGLKYPTDFERFADKYLEALTDRRHELNLTQRTVAIRLGISPSAFSRMELGHQVPSTKTLYRWAEAVGMKPEVVFTKE